MKQKRFLTLLLLIGQIFALLAFTPIKTAETRAADFTGTKTQVNYWSIYPATDPYTPLHNEYVQMFIDENPDIEILHQGTNFWDYFTKINTAQAGGDKIDVYWQDIVSVKFRAKNKVAKNLNYFLETYNVDMSQWTESDLDTVSYEGGIFAMVFSSDSRILYYNKDHFKAAGLDPEKPPTSFEELKEFSKKLTIYEDEEKRRLLQVGFHPRLGNNAIQQIVWPMGGNFFDDLGNPTLNLQENIDAVSWWIEVATQYPLRAMNGFTAEHSEGTGKDQSFMRGATSIIIDGDWLAWQIEKYAPELNYGVAPIPYTSEEFRSNWSGGFTLEMSDQSSGDVADGAWRFMEFMTGPYIQTDMITKLDFLPANVKAIDALYNSSNENQKKVFDEFHFRRHVDYCEASPEWWLYVNEQLSKAESGDIDATEAMNRAQANLLAVMDEFVIISEGIPIPWGWISLFMSGVIVLVCFLIAVQQTRKIKKRRSKHA